MVIGLNIIQVDKSITIGVGSVMTTNILDNVVVVGNPAKIMKRKES